jgi:tetraacyldisaccharide 4'-kinase
MKYLRLLLFPFSLIYWLVVTIRNWCYDAGLFKSTGFNRPVIVVGNLDVGGAGKSPMTEYLIRLFKDNYKPTVLSRGYGRKTKGFLLAADNPLASDIGDEPSQFKHKFPDVTVAVCEKRVAGIEHLRDKYGLVILDDAYQHRALKPGFSILLFDYNRLTDPRFVLPAGNLRESFNGRRRANIIVVSKCPATLSDDDVILIKKNIRPFRHQALFFTAISYLPFRKLNGATVYQTVDEQTNVFLLTGIASPEPLFRHLKKLTPHIHHHNYPDHHQFTLKNISKLADDFAACAAQKKIIITTEKDAQRLGEQELQSALQKLPVLVLPIGISFLNNGRQQFDNLVTEYAKQY